jgi:hypothetical protein
MYHHISPADAKTPDTKTLGAGMAADLVLGPGKLDRQLLGGDTRLSYCQKRAH